jgi:hypothetical protein
VNCVPFVYSMLFILFVNIYIYLFLVPHWGRKVTSNTIANNLPVPSPWREVTTRKLRREERPSPCGDTSSDDCGLFVKTVSIEINWHNLIVIFIPL